MSQVEKTRLELHKSKRGLKKRYAKKVAGQPENRTKETSDAKYTKRVLKAKGLSTKGNWRNMKDYKHFSYRENVNEGSGGLKKLTRQAKKGKVNIAKNLTHMASRLNRMVKNKDKKRETNVDRSWKAGARKFEGQPERRKSIKEGSMSTLRLKRKAKAVANKIPIKNNEKEVKNWKSIKSREKFKKVDSLKRMTGIKEGSLSQRKIKRMEKSAHKLYKNGKGLAGRKLLGKVFVKKEKKAIKTRTKAQAERNKNYTPSKQPSAEAHDRFWKGAGNWRGD